MEKNLVAVFTGKSLKKGILADGGSGHWRARKNRIVEAKYLLCVRNQRESWAENDFEHGTAFLIARISGTSPSTHEGRVIINFSKYAEICIKDAWHICTKGQRYPVAYLNSDQVQKDLNLDFESLDWKNFNKNEIENNIISNNNTKNTVVINNQKTYIQEAKAMLSASLNVPEENIEITIKF